MEGIPDLRVEKSPAAKKEQANEFAELQTGEMPPVPKREPEPDAPVEQDVSDHQAETAKPESPSSAKDELVPVSEVKKSPIDPADKAKIVARRIKKSETKPKQGAVTSNGKERTIGAIDQLVIDTIKKAGADGLTLKELVQQVAKSGKEYAYNTIRRRKFELDKSHIIASPGRRKCGVSGREVNYYIIA